LLSDGERLLDVLGSSLSFIVFESLHSSLEFVSHSFKLISVVISIDPLCFSIVLSLDSLLVLTVSLDVLEIPAIICWLRRFAN
jgi:hypothetical protein